MTTTTIKHDPFAALKIKNFTLFIFARFTFTLAVQIQAVVVAYQVYKITRDEYSLGLIGLAEALPFIVVALFSGYVVDRNDRKKIILIATIVLLIASAILLSFALKTSSVISHFGVWPIYLTISVVGVARSFLGPGFFSFLAQLIPRQLYANAATWNTTIWHTGAVIGPAIAGFLLFDLRVAYSLVTLLIILSFLFICFIPSQPSFPVEKKESIGKSLGAGIRFVFSNQIVLGALSLDLFAVLFGGAVAMLPAFAEKILHDETMLGWLKAAPAVGAVITSFIMAYLPPAKNAGRNLFLSVAAFGIASVLFGLSTNFYWAFFLLAVTGAFDNVSVVIRHTVLQLMTPENMRGRVAAVNSIFIGSSNEIGAYESGLAARLMGLVPSIVFGGAMTMVVVGITAKMAPKLRKLNLNQWNNESKR